MNDTGGSAFPQEKVYVYGNQKTTSLGAQGGMSLRDYFAAKAMQGFISNPELVLMYNAEDTAKWAYERADAMLKARES